MPIHFRCQHCRQKLSITRRKAGEEMVCPGCGTPILVPTLDQAGAGSEQPPAEAPRPAVSSESPPAGSATAAAKPDASPAAAPSPVPPVDHPPSAPQRSLGEITPETRALWSAAARQQNPWADDDEFEEPEFNIRGGTREIEGLDMTPMVDVTFLLLIFFMITAAFSMQKSLPTEAPAPEDAVAQSLTLEDLEEKSVIVEITAEDELIVDELPVSGLPELLDVLRAKVAEGMTEMLIEADYRATHGTVVAVTDAGMDAAMQAIRRNTRRSED